MGQTAALVGPAPTTVASIIAGALRPLVRRIDTEGLYPADALRQLGEAGTFAHHTQALGEGSRGIGEAVAAMADVGAECLSTAFCIWCQDALVWYLDRADNSAPRERYLADVAAGVRLGGTGLSNPMKFFSGLEPLALKGVHVAGGYRVTGRLPYVSNLDEGHLFASIFALEDAADRKIMAVFRASHDGVSLARNAHFIALEGTGTYSTLIRQAFVPDEDVLSDDAAHFVPRIRQGFVLLQAGMGLGIAQGAARLMRSDGPSGRHAAHLPLGPDAIEARAVGLEARLAAHASAVEVPERKAFLEVLRTRLDISWLALEAAQAAMLQFGARGYLVGSEAERRLREAQFVAIVTPSVKHILAELAKG
jgi:alkylation response protein AidB-like acyl-CoA dehydrogenase